MACQYTIDGTTYNLAEFKAFLVDGGLDRLFPDGKYPFVVPGAIGETIIIDGKERPTRNSNGQLIHQTEEGIRNFWRWFGDSKVVDDQGRPLVVYHGSRLENGPDEFKNNGGKGIYFAENSDISENYTNGNGNLGEYFLKSDNHLDISDSQSESVIDDVEAYLWEDDDERDEVLVGPDGRESLHELMKWGNLIFLGRDIQDKVIKELGRRGFTGVKMRDFHGGIDSDTVNIVFNPNQIKSATDNTGEFSKSNPDIRYSITAKTSGIPVNNLQEMVNRIAGEYKGLPTVHVLSNASDAPEALRNEIERHGASNTVEGAMHGGEIYLFADNLSSIERAEFVLAEHEVTHIGLRGILGDALPAEMNKLYRDNARIRKLATEYQKQSPVSNAVAVEEVLADMTNDELAGLKGWRGFVQKLADWFHAHGFNRIADMLAGNQAESDRYAAELVKSARDYVKTGAGRVSSADDRLSILYHGSGQGEKITEIRKRTWRDDGYFDGVFTSGNKDTAESHGDVVTAFDVDDEKIASSYDIEDAASYEELVSLIKEKYPNASDDHIENVLYPAIIEDKNVYRMDADEVFEATGRDDIGEASWDLQNARGYVAQKLGFDAVKMKDEHGTSYLIPYGSKAKILDDVPRLSRGNPIQKAKAKLDALRLKPETIDKLIYEFQDKYVDLKRLRDHIKKMGGTINDLNDAYEAETRYHGRMAKRTKNFLKHELLPLQGGLRAANITIEEFERFLHARHAPEANAEMAKRNPSQAEIDAGQQAAKDAVKNLQNQLAAAKKNGSATKAIDDALRVAQEELKRWNGAQAFKGSEVERLALSGMSDAEARAIIDGLPPAKRLKMYQLAEKVDAINEKTLVMLEEYGLMSRESLNAWRKAYRYYVPLHRDEAHPDSVSHPIGQGFSTRGDAARQRVGSNAKVTHILGHIAMQREAAITRGEKNNVMKSLYLMARQNPLPDYWTTEIPKQSYIDSQTGFVRTGVDPLYKQRPNVLMLRVAGKDTAIVFNEHNPQAARLAQAMKNLDVDNLHYLIPFIGKGTRWLAAVNTQYNPIFGIINFMRDVQTAALNLSTTRIAGKQSDVLKNTTEILREVLKNKGRLPESGKWGLLREEFESMGGTTGYRDLFLSPEDRSKALLDELKAMDRGQISKAAHAIVDWLSDYNEAMENSVRLAAYKAGIDAGMSKASAAVMAKNLTVNFNRKGRQARELGALYAFFNAALQGSARMYETLSGPAGKKIMAGGVMLGAMNALIGLAMMGGGDGDDDEWSKIPEFIKERSLIIPIGHEDYIALPMPLGFNFLHNIGRIAVEASANGGRHIGRDMANLAGVIADAFNPLGSSSSVSQMAAPTVLDPIVALMENKDWTGRPIYKEDFNSLDPSPGFKRTKTTATPWSRAVAEVLNNITGGTDYAPGAWSPTPDQIDFVIGQITGGIGREVSKTADVIGSAFSDDELPAHKIPLVGRLYGNTRGQAGQADEFYENLRESNIIENELKGRMKDGKPTDDFEKENPNAFEIMAYGNMADKQVKALREQRDYLKANKAPSAEIQAVSQGITEAMKDFNRRMRELN